MKEILSAIFVGVLVGLIFVIVIVISNINILQKLQKIDHQNQKIIQLMTP